jgi:hypothetical protein
LKRVERAVGGDYAIEPSLHSKSKRNCARSGSDVDGATPAVFSSARAQSSEDFFDQHLCFGARYENSLVHLEDNVTENRRPHGVSEGSAFSKLSRSSASSIQSSSID